MILPYTTSEVCACYAAGLCMNGAALSMFKQPVEASDVTTAELEGWQFVVGQGPSIDAFDLNAPVEVPDIAGTVSGWCLFDEFLTRAKIGATFAFPIAINNEPIGALTFYRAESRPLTMQERRDARALAALAAITSASRYCDPGIDPSARELVPTRFDELHMATGIVMAQLRVGPAEAQARIRAHAFAEQRPLPDVLLAILHQRIHLPDDRAGR